jgi:hypothetical protein
MVVHDLRSAGMVGPEDDVTSFPKAAATDALINYLTGLAVMEGPVARLGYSYWAESVYGEITPLLAAARTSLALTDRQMTFFIAHSVSTRGTPPMSDGLSKGSRPRRTRRTPSTGLPRRRSG